MHTLELGSISGEETADATGVSTDRDGAGEETADKEARMSESAKKLSANSTSPPSSGNPCFCLVDIARVTAQTEKTSGNLCSRSSGCSERGTAVTSGFNNTFPPAKSLPKMKDTPSIGN